MNWVEIFESGLTSLAENAPFAFVVIAVMVFTYFMYNKSLNTLKGTFDKGIDVLEKSYEKSSSNAQETIISLYEVLKDKK